MMKKLLFSLLLALLPLSLLAQKESKHLSFMGIPIDGKLQSFVEKLKQKGCHIKWNDNTGAILSGDFSNSHNCSFMVYSTKKDKLVYNVAVVFPQKDNWTTLHDEYLRLKYRLTEKYGESISSIERFVGEKEPSDDFLKYHALQEGRCNYMTVYKVESGRIGLFIDFNNGGRVVISYIDDINGTIKVQEEKDDL